MKASAIVANESAHGSTICAVRDRETFTVSISDANNVPIGTIPGVDSVPIGTIPGVDSVPHGLMLAEGYVQGYYAGMAAGQKRMYCAVCKLFNVPPDLKTLAAIGNAGKNSK